MNPVSLTLNQSRESGYSHLIIVWNRNIICQDFAHGHVYQVVGKRSPTEKSESSSDHPRFESNNLQPAIWVRFRSIRPLKNSWFNMLPIINDNMETTCHTPTILESNPFECCCFSFLVSTDVTNLFRQRFRKPCADENVASASSWLHISLPRASALVGLGDLLPRPRCRGCFSILWEYYCVF